MGALGPEGWRVRIQNCAEGTNEVLHVLIGRPGLPIDLHDAIQHASRINTLIQLDIVVIGNMPNDKA
jgi:hypothetical protein